MRQVHKGHAHGVEGEEKKSRAVVGSYGSGVSIAAGEIFADAMIPAMGASCTNPQVTFGNDFYFRVAFLDPFQGTVMANYAFQNGAKKAAVITQLGDDYSSGLGSFFTNAFVALAGEDGIVVLLKNKNTVDYYRSLFVHSSGTTNKTSALYRFDDHTEIRIGKLI